MTSIKHTAKDELRSKTNGSEAVQTAVSRGESNYACPTPSIDRLLSVIPVSRGRMRTNFQVIIGSMHHLFCWPRNKSRRFISVALMWLMSLRMFAFAICPNHIGANKCSKSFAYWQSQMPIATRLLCSRAQPIKQSTNKANRSSIH